MDNLKEAQSESLALSGIQHFLFCPRQWALIQIEQQWGDNYLTASGSVLHERTHDDSCRELRGDILTVRALKVCSKNLGIHGVCDVVEYHRDPHGVSLPNTPGLWSPFPVEYKRGVRKITDCDRAQLCAQAICLEEMHGCVIPYGAMYYFGERHREQIVFDNALRNLVIKTSQQMHEMYALGQTPPPKIMKACKNCSLIELCLPKLTNTNKVAIYLQSDLEAE